MFLLCSFLYLVDCKYYFQPYLQKDIILLKKPFLERLRGYESEQSSKGTEVQRDIWMEEDSSKECNEIQWMVNTKLRRDNAAAVSVE